MSAKIASFVSALIIVMLVAFGLFWSGDSDPASADKNNKETEAHQNYDDFETRQSGLKVKVLKEGTGDNAKDGKRVYVHYTGKFEKDGKVFDTSATRGEPIAFVLGKGQVIKGWDEGINGMKVGGKRILVIPHDLAYGPQGYPGAIPPYSTLVFEVELMDVKN